MAASTGPSQPSFSRLRELTPDSDRIQELSDAGTDSEFEDIATVPQYELDNIAYFDRMRPIIVDDLKTETSEVQDETLNVILPFLEGNPNEFPLNEFGLPHLQRVKHARYLDDALGSYSEHYVALDAARPWVLYWSLQALTALGEGIGAFQTRVVNTFVPCQHPDGGYGGGHGQLPHLAPTYAAILSLAIAGGAAAYESINRRSLWHYLGRMKQPDGGFTMAPGGEEDIRGAYCAMVCLSLLNLPLELPADAPARSCGMTNFLDQLGDWISRCQNWEGGISATPGNEAHGAYAFCGLGCLSIMGPPKETLNRYLDVPRLIRWLSYRQCTPEGGYNGRTNKLVDGCYSHWVGSCWALVEAANGTGIWNRTALARYILSAAQAKTGGLIDKPGKRADAYHTCYNLAGLSAVQYNHVFDEDMKGSVGVGELAAPYHWWVAGLYEEGKIWVEEDMVDEIHPVFIMPYDAVSACRKYFEDKEGF
ncbi:CaaX farnesyltransferase beta subunit Ram1 [Sporormia fimetaria CBS 119925]|uniref:Protein farnesyltransferase subunit beta n=1 Tax=Sporormia fimetaria CBS 119925 TaxID=1340428 RepID=A0A6A6V0S9_9PLEO|nr:CaaX farnesyltransferase beta subunit Ram1 [Sporormia fimetaria CBS 119925]